MRTARGRTARALLAGAALALVGLLPGSAQARTDTDPCPSHPGTGVFNDGHLACDFLTDIPAGEGRYLGPPLTDANEDANYLPDSQLQCPLNTRIPGTGYWGSSFAYNWDWDYYVAGGSWVLWDGRISDYWPGGGTILDTGVDGYNSFTAPFTNWGTGDPITVRLFWGCEETKPDVGREAARPETGDAGDDGLQGNEHENALIGCAGDDRLLGRAGADHLPGGAGEDTRLAGPGDDLMHGRRGSDRVVGGGGSDDILPGRGRDVARGGKDADQLFDDEGQDLLRGGRANDRFSARDGDRDVIRCGGGEDIAIIDSEDVAIDC